MICFSFSHSVAGWSSLAPPVRLAVIHVLSRSHDSPSNCLDAIRTHQVLRFQKHLTQFRAKGYRQITCQGFKLSNRNWFAPSCHFGSYELHTPMHQRLSPGSRLMRDTTEKRRIALCNLPLWMAPSNLYSLPLWVNIFLRDLDAATHSANAIRRSINIFHINHLT